MRENGVNEAKGCDLPFDFNSVRSSVGASQKRQKTQGEKELAEAFEECNIGQAPYEPCDLSAFLFNLLLTIYLIYEIIYVGRGIDTDNIHFPKLHT